MDRPTGSDWRARISSEVEAKVAETRSNRNRRLYLSRIDLDIPHGDLLPLILEASARRGTSKTTYARRALLAYLAWDLGIPFAEVVRMDNRFTGPNARFATADPGGALGGPWEIA